MFQSIKRLMWGIAITTSVHAQEEPSTCYQEYQYVVSYVESNLPGFRDTVSKDYLPKYNAFKSRLSAKAKSTKNKFSCFKLLTLFIESFEDNHTYLQMDYQPLDENDETAYQAFLKSDQYLATEIVELKPEDYQQYPLDEVKGIYQTANGSYKLALVESDSEFYDYLGVIVESKTKLWKPGQVKLYLMARPHGGFQAMVAVKNHTLTFDNRFYYRNGILGPNWFKTNRLNFSNPAMNQDTEFQFKKIDEDTVYLRLPTFSGYETRKINELYAQVKPLLQKSKNLIIDVRNNGGGSDSNAMPLLDYIYTQPIDTDKVSMYVTPDNIKNWQMRLEDMKQNPDSFNTETIAYVESLITQMKEAKPGSFLPVYDGEKIERDKVLSVPEKVIIIQNRLCASACESLLFWAKQSSKTTLVGENSGGYVGYGEIHIHKTPHYGFRFQTSMSRYEKQREFEPTGIKPDIYLNYSIDWIEQVMTILKK